MCVPAKPAGGGFGAKPAGGGFGAKPVKGGFGGEGGVADIPADGDDDDL